MYSRIYFFITILAVLILIPSTSFGYNLSCAGKQALVFSGANSATDSCDFYRDLDRVSENFSNFKCKVFIGPDKKKRRQSCEKVPPGKKSFEKGDLDLISNTWEKSKKWPHGEWSVLKHIVEVQARQLPPGEPFMLYFTDHGGRKHNEKSGKREANVQFGNSELSIEQLEVLIKIIRKENPTAQIVSIHDHCYGGGMLRAQYKFKNICGFSSASPWQPSYNGESVARHFARMKEGNNGKSVSLGDLIDSYKKNTLSGSSPTSTSSLFLRDHYTDFQKKLTGEQKAMLNIVSADELSMGKISPSCLPPPKSEKNNAKANHLIEDVNSVIKKEQQVFHSEVRKELSIRGDELKLYISYAQKAGIEINNITPFWEIVEIAQKYERQFRQIEKEEMRHYAGGTKWSQKKKDKLTEKLSPLRRLTSAFIDSLALKMIENSYDKKALDKYKTFKRCENVKISLP